MANGVKKGVSLDSSLVTKAVDALLKHHETKSANDLLGSEANVHLQIGLVVAPKDPPSRHYNIQLPHAIYKDLSDAEVCLFVKDDEMKRHIQELKEQFPDLLQPIVKIMTLQSLRSKHGDYGQRRSLLKKYTQFMADDRIIPMMPAALGRDFIKKSKLPMSIKLTRDTALPYVIQTALRSTYYTVKGGTCVNVRVAVTSMPNAHIVENILQASQQLHLATKSIQSLCIKLPDSAALPLYNQSPEQLYDVIEMARKEEEETAKARKAVKKEKPKALKTPLLKALKKQATIEKGDEDMKDSEEGDEEADTSAEVDEASPVKEEPTSSKKKRQNKEAKTPETNKKSKKSGDVKVQSSPEDEGKTKDATTPTSKSKGKKVKDEAKTPATNVKSENTDTSSSKSKKTPQSKDEPESTKKNKKDGTSKDSSTPKSKKDGKQVKVEEEKSSESNKKRKNKKDDSPSPAKKNKADAEFDSKAEFVSTKKFIGSKTGYVYKKGPKGLGYYVDVKPVADKAAMDALRRSRGPSQSPKSRGSSQKRGSSKSRSKSRGSSNDSRRRR